VDCGDEDLAAAQAVEDAVGGAGDDELTEVGFGEGVAQAGIEFQGLDKRDDARGEALGSEGIVEGDVGADFTEAGEGKGRPDDFEWAGQLCQRASLWDLPQTHLGSGSSLRVPQERSQAFISS
jgi:hypothetical protein